MSNKELQNESNLKTSVIIIDDDIDNAESTEDLMKLKGIEILAVGYDGKDAIELYEKHKPDVVLLDLVMPEYDGYYAVKGISKIDPNAKVILVSGSTDDILDEITKFKIVDSVIAKPFNHNDLIKKILN